MSNQCPGLLSHFNQVLYVLCFYKAQISGERLPTEPLVLWLLKDRVVICQNDNVKGEVHPMLYPMWKTAF